jgi:hypothetical protein
MHVTKGVFEITIGLLIDIAGKMKDELNTSKDLQVHGIREEQHTKKDQIESFTILLTLHPHK